MSDLSLIVPKHSLAVDVKHSEVKAKIMARVVELGLQQGKYKMDTNLLNLITELIEHLICKADGVSKKELALDIMETLYGLSADERLALGNSIEFLHSNKLIKKVSIYKLFKTSVKEWLGKKK